MKCTEPTESDFQDTQPLPDLCWSLLAALWGARGKKLCSLGFARCMFGIAAWTSQEGIIKVEVPVSVSGLNVINMILTYCT